MGAENRVEDAGEDGNRSHGKMLQDPVRDTVRAQGLAGRETPDGFENLVGVINCGSLAVLRN